MTQPNPSSRPGGSPRSGAGSGAESGAGSGGGRIIGIASGKGGVGKTWFSVTLAHALTRAGRRVLLFDADLGLANVDIQLGLTPKLDLGTVIAGRATLPEVILRHAGGDFDVVPGRSGSGALAGIDPASLERTLAALREVAAGYDLVLLDLGAGLDRAVRRLATFADMLLVLVTEEPTSLTDAYAVLKLHGADRPGGDASVVVNQATNRASGERTYATLARACSTFLGRAPPLLGVVRRDERVRDAIRHQTPLMMRHPNCPAAEDVEAIVSGLLAVSRAGRPKV